MVNPTQPKSETQSLASAVTSPVSTPPEKPAKPYNKNWKKWIAIGVLALIFIGGGSLVLSQQKSQEPEAVSTVKPIASSPSPTTDPTADWKTYTNTKYNYSVNYPSGIKINGSSVAENVEFADQINITVSPNNPEDCRGDCDSGELIGEVTVGNIKGKKYRKVKGRAGGRIPQNYEEIVIPHNGFYYILSVNELKFTSDNSYASERKFGPIPADAQRLFGQILSTFKFTEQSDRFAHVEKEIRSDLGYDDPAVLYVEVSRISDDYAAIGVGATNGNGGGRQFLIKANGKWTPLWSGQFDPYCSEMIEKQIPKEIYEECKSDN